VRVEEKSKNPNYLAVKFLYQGGQTDIVAVDVGQVLFFYSILFQLDISSAVYWRCVVLTCRRSRSVHLFSFLVFYFLVSQSVVMCRWPWKCLIVSQSQQNCKREDKDANRNFLTCHLRSVKVEFDYSFLCLTIRVGCH
jgi:Expansin C-terminal domain